LSKPLIANNKRQSESAAFHKAVFQAFGGPKRLCSLCGKPGATDAAHVVPRAILGPLRYADARLARPAHRGCHEAQERGERDFAIEIRRDAIRAHNLISKVRLMEPER
jgi:hypothetical protein